MQQLHTCLNVGYEQGGSQEMLEQLEFECDTFIDASGKTRKARIIYKNQAYKSFELLESPAFSRANAHTGYVAAGIPIEFHCHGMKEQDFSNFISLDLQEVNNNAQQEGVFCIVSVSLPHQYLNKFLLFMKKFAAQRQAGELPYLLGISLEGPLLASFGGTPPPGTWAPTKPEWEQLAMCGKLGLTYTVLSPDAMLPGSCLAPQLTAQHPTIEWIVATLLQGGVRPALGHFQKSDPAASADCIQSVLQAAQAYGNLPYSGWILTDHVFNDMPLRFRHTWRLPAEKRLRPLQLKDLRIDEWTMDNLGTMLGEVPATLLQAAKDGLVTLCINFDGEHVDLEVCRKIIELVGSKAISAITDSTDINMLGGQSLWKREEVNLWYQKNGIVAAGMSSLDTQIQNLRSIEVNEAMIWDMVSFVPASILDCTSKGDSVPLWSSYVSESNQRYCIKR